MKKSKIGKILLRGANEIEAKKLELQTLKYRKEAEQLEKFYLDKSKLPSKLALSEEKNIQYDYQRLDYILQALNFLIKHHSSNQHVTSWSFEAREFYDALQLLNARNLIEHIAYTIFNLSGTLRAKYKLLLGPHPFTWETFEQLGGLMKLAPPKWCSILVNHVERESANCFVDEILHSELIIEAALPTLIKDDIPQLMRLFEYIKNAENSTTAAGNFPPVNLTAIKALTRRMRDTKSLEELIKNSDNRCTALNYRDILSQIEKTGEPDLKYLLGVHKSQKQYSRKFNLKDKLGIHAALRRLEMIGEMVTGKNFSSLMKELDPTIDWQALITIRDMIAHQDEKDNKKKIAALIADESLFKAIMQDEMDYLSMQLAELIKKREEKLPKFNSDNIPQFWEKVYKYEQKIQNELIEKNRMEQAAKIQPRISKEETEIFLNALRSNSCPLEKQLRWLGIFNGLQTLPDKREKDELLTFLPSRKENRELYNQCKTIAEAVIKPRTDPASREEVRKKNQEAAKQREDEIKRNFTGLAQLRKFLKSVDNKNSSEAGLTRVQRVAAAIEALENIKEFMEQEDTVKMNFDFKNLKEFSKALNSKKTIYFFATLITNPEFNDAIEYDAAQLLQHLDSIRKFPEAAGCEYLKENYDGLRYLRNYVEHGNALHDSEEYNPKKSPSLLTYRQKKLGPIMIVLIFKLLPYLKKIKQMLEAQQPLVSNNHNSNGDNSNTITFFSPSSSPSIHNQQNQIPMNGS